ncbi:MAG: Uma2 family endonuclease [Dethiobacter sp.]|nr:Uma2 family endonuclease [Dethiobacter sp.]
MPLPNPEKKYTYADYLAWPASERWEIYDGTAYMQAAPSWQHQSVTGELYRQLSNHFVGKRCRVFAAPFDLCLAEHNETDDEVDTVVQPDVVVVCDESKLRKTGYFGVPALIIEVTSPATSRRDRVSKFNMYEKAGVEEYWIVDPEGKFANVFVLQESKKYGRPETHTDEDNVQAIAFPDLGVDLSMVFANV